MAKQETIKYHYEKNADILQELDDPSNDSYKAYCALAPIESSKMVVKFDTNNEDLKAKLDSMMENINDGGRNKWRCTICGKTAILKMM